MEAPSPVIHHSMLVSDVNRQFPQCAPVFEKYGIAGCGGEYGPPEPLFIFAAAHHVPLPELIAELNAAARGEWQDESAPAASTTAAAPAQTAATETLYKRFVYAALLVAITAGFSLGVVNLTRIAAAQSYYSIGGVLKQVHAHAQIFGWVGLLVMGVALHAVPRFKMVTARPAWAIHGCLWLTLAGVVLRVISQPFAREGFWSVAMLVSAMLELAGVGLFLWLIVRIAVRSEQPREFYEKFLAAALFWLAVLAIWNVALVGQMFFKGQVAVRSLPQALFVQVAFYGFMANMIFGFSLRVLPHFLGLRDAKIGAANLAFICWNGALLLRYPLEHLAWAATILETLGAVLFVYALGIFARRRTTIDIQGVDPSFGWFLSLGYGWLLVTAVLPFHADVFRLSASSRHALAIGFVTPMIFGVAYRVLPIFNGVNLWSNQLMRISFWHLAFGTTLSLAMAFNAAYGATWTYLWSAAAGYAVFAALLMFALNLALTLRVQHEAYTAGQPVGPNTRVAELLEVYPWLRPVLIHNGLGGLAARRHNPPRFVTIEFAARRHGIDPQPLLTALNDEIQRRTA